MVRQGRGRVLAAQRGEHAADWGITLFNHYSMLATAEQLLGLPKLGLAASYPTMTKAFNL